MSNQDAIKLSTDSDNVVQILDVKSAMGKNGMWHLYTVKKDGQRVKFFAPTEKVHEKLSAFQMNDVVNIRKEEWGAGKSVWKVTYQGSEKSSGNVSIDDRTHDIHKQVCLKLAVDMVAKKDTHTILTDAELVIIKANMTALLDVLENNDAQDLDTSPKPEEIGEEDNFPF
tara:strand:- start:3620 stop:4129 length:510 start_codon:yes stop_codon:yes gene_type:complete